MANRIREIRKTKDITLEDLSERTGISYTHLSRIEGSKRGLSLENVIRIARALETEPIEITDEFDHDQLIQAEGLPMLVSMGDDRAKDIPEIDVVAGLGAGGLTIVEQTSLSNGITFAKEVVRDHWRLPDWQLNRMNAKAHHIAAFPAQGDSMLPTIGDGDVVFVDTRHRVPSPPGIYALADEFGGVVVKRLEVTSRPGEDVVTVRVSSDNPLHKDRELTLPEINIIGRFVGRFTVT